MEDRWLNTWEQFIELAGNLDIGPAVIDSYCFRGHADKDWKLQPSLLRHLLRLDLDYQKAITLEFAATRHFLSQAHLHLPHGIPFPNADDLFGCWSLMQHYGSPTRLLDWTYSIYVAAYFAVIERFDKDGAIWLAHPAKLAKKMVEKYEYKGLPETGNQQKQLFTYKDADPILDFVSRNFRTDRMIAQQGSYTLCLNPLLDHGQILHDSLDYDDGKIKLEKLIIPAKNKTLFIRKLRLMNITASTLFPGLDGLGKSVSELITLGL